MPVRLDDPAALLAADDFVRRTARALLGDQGFVDDVAQDVRLALLDVDPAAGESRGFLRTLARRLAFRRKAAEAARRRRELAAARSESIPSVAEVLAQEETRRHVVDAVLALPPDARDAVLLRWFVDLPPREAARRLGIPVETFRTRLKRAHVVLRERLEAAHGGRARWISALLPLAGLGVPPAAGGAGAVAPIAKLKGASLMAAKWKSSLLCVAGILATAYFGAMRKEPASENDVDGGSAPSQAEGPSQGSSESAPPTPADPDRSPIASAPFIEPPAADSKPSAPEQASLRIRLLWSDGTPAAAVSATYVADDFPRMQRYLSPEWIRDVSQLDGALPSKSFAPGSVGVYIDRNDASRHFKLESGGATEAEITLDRGIMIEGRVVDDSGAAVPSAGIHFTDGTGHTLAQPEVLCDENGRFSLRDVSARSIVAKAPGCLTSAPQSVHGDPGDRQAIDFVVSRGAGGVEGVVTDEAGRPVHGAYVRIGEGGCRFTDSFGRFSSTSEEPGTQDVVVRSLTHAPWRGVVDIPVGRAARMEIRLSVGAEVRGIVRTSDGAPAEGAELQVRYDEDAASLEPIFLALRTDGGGEYVARGLRPGEFRINVDAGPRGSASARLSVLGGQVVNWNALLSLRNSVRGTVVESDGAPLRAGLAVQLRARERDGRSRHLAESFLSAEAPTFAFNVDDEHPLELRVYFGTTDHDLSVVEDVRPGASAIVLQLPPRPPPPASLRGRAVSTDGVPLKEVAVTLYDQRRETGFGKGAEPTTGVFDFTSLEPGKYWIEVEAAGRPPVRCGLIELHSGESRDLGDVRFEDAGRLKVRATASGIGSIAAFSVQVQTPDGRFVAYIKQGAEASATGEIASPRIAEGPSPEFVLAPGDYVVAVSPDDKLSAPAYVACTVPPGGTVEAVVACGRATSILLAVEAPTGTAFVEIEVRRGGILLAEYGVAPGPLWVPLAPGNYEVTARDPNRKADVVVGLVVASGPAPSEPTVIALPPKK